MGHTVFLDLPVIDATESYTVTLTEGDGKRLMRIAGADVGDNVEEERVGLVLPNDLYWHHPTDGLYLVFAISSLVIRTSSMSSIVVTTIPLGKIQVGGHRRLLILSNEGHQGRCIFSRYSTEGP
jgi:hypothetical protein